MFRRGNNEAMAEEIGVSSQDLDILEVYAQDVTRDIDLTEVNQEALLEATEMKEARGLDLHQHHVFSQEFRDQFAERGVDIDAFTIDIDPGEHLGQVHSEHVHDWNASWEDFWEFVTEQEASAGQPLSQDEFGLLAHAQASAMLDEAGLSNYELHAYKDRDALTSLDSLISKDSEGAAFSAQDLQTDTDFATDTTSGTSATFEGETPETNSATSTSYLEADPLEIMRDPSAYSYEARLERGELEETIGVNNDAADFAALKEAAAQNETMRAAGTAGEVAGAELVDLAASIGGFHSTQAGNADYTDMVEGLSVAPYTDTLGEPPGDIAFPNAEENAEQQSVEPETGPQVENAEETGHATEGSGLVPSSEREHPADIDNLDLDTDLSSEDTSFESDVGTDTGSNDSTPDSEGGAEGGSEGGGGDGGGD
jgi:hypothetical protein